MSQRKPAHPRRGQTGPGHPFPLGPLRRLRRGSGGSRSTASAGRSRGKKWLLRALWAVLALGVLGLVAVGIAYARTDIPDANELADGAGLDRLLLRRQDRDGPARRRRRATASRCRCPRCPTHVQKAVLAAEDRTSTRTTASRPTGIARAVWSAIKGGQATQGGSTITQQYVKNYFLTPDRTLIAQGQGDPHLGQDRPAAVQGPDPRELPQHDLLRPRRLRHPDRVEGVLRQGRLAS